ncbi:MAG: DUF3791 domain-containing protein [Bacteroidales bacterium]|nr:DUF3791 domain-containing protein [Bacteroidales bacterium]
MRDNVLWRKIARIIVMIADGLQISSERALDLFYKSNVYEMLVDPRYGLQTMSDTYIYDEFMMELRGE